MIQKIFVRWRRFCYVFYIVLMYYFAVTKFCLWARWGEIDPPVFLAGVGGGGGPVPTSSVTGSWSNTMYTRK